ncbi:hypothetical protein L3V83_07190 [Thiotrichales bacterium 19X7-9]|nr:hypothetical protein [Thiotrichales bacterium 19X7-9]
MIKVNGGTAYIYGGWKLDDFKNVLDECANIGINLEKIYIQKDNLQLQNENIEDFTKELESARNKQQEKVKEIKNKFPESLFQTAAETMPACPQFSGSPPP